MQQFPMNPDASSLAFPLVVVERQDEQGILLPKAFGNVAWYMTERRKNTSNDLGGVGYPPPVIYTPQLGQADQCTLGLARHKQLEIVAAPLKNTPDCL